MHEASAEAESVGAEDEEEESEQEEFIAAPPSANLPSEPPKPKKQKPKDEKLLQELAEVDSLLAGLETSKDATSGESILSKAAQKRAKKKAKEVGSEVSCQACWPVRHHV